MQLSRIFHVLAGLLLLGPVTATGSLIDDPHGSARSVSPPSSFVPYLNADGRFGFVDRDGRMAFTGTFEDAQPFSEGRAAVKSGGKWGYIDLGGQWIVRPRFTEATSFENGRAWAVIVRPATRQGFIDLNPLHTSGSRRCYLIAPDGHTRSCGGDYPEVPSSDHAGEKPFGAPRLRVVRAPDGKSDGVLDSNGRQIIPFGIYGELRYQDEGLFVGRGTHGWGILDAVRNVEVVPFNRPDPGHLKYTSPDLHPRLLVVRGDDDSWCILDRSGTALRCGLNDVSHWGESLIAARDGQAQWGAVDTRGKPVIPFLYDSEFRFRRGLARVRIGDREFYIDLQGREYRTSHGPG